MKKRPAARKKVTTIEGLAELMVGEFERVDERFERVDARLERVDARLEKIEEQIVSINGELRNVHVEMREINRRLDALERSIADVRGYAVEIDELRARVKRMEAFLRSQGMPLPR